MPRPQRRNPPALRAEVTSPSGGEIPAATRLPRSPDEPSFLTIFRSDPPQSGAHRGWRLSYSDWSDTTAELARFEDQPRHAFDGSAYDLTYTERWELLRRRAAAGWRGGTENALS
jgi:hypothetical protein